ncbi:hypothetical protein F5X68DRAFT_270531 [Plectosphaerella plurivora]|uniref:Uncharacterized protein n=1 Tax=Plectosphaerella plurivora TaxID=936078 RepID=A0A9P9A8T0_9PEZI|nr:hypothetical protein F5X68DRAFT_270531 [Plectosphaerella plurivora]
MSSPSSSLTWQQVTPGIESFYSSIVVLYEGTGRMFFGMTGFLSLSVENATEEAVDEALQKAWQTLRYDHPTLGSQVTQNEEKTAFFKTYKQFTNDNDRVEWLQKTFVPISNGQTGLEWANSDPPAPHIPTLFVVKPPSTSDGVVRRDLVFRSPHDIIDGIGALIMLNNLISHAAHAFKEGTGYQLPIFDGSEAANLSPVYRIAANTPEKLSPEQEAHLKHVVEEKARVAAATDAEVLGLPYKEGATVPGKHQRVALTLSAEQTSQLLAASKKAGMTPTHLYHAALAMVNRDIQPPSAETKRVRYINYILRNERPSCQEPYSTSKHPAAVYHSVSGPPLTVDMDLLDSGKTADAESRREEFRSIAQKMKDFYEEVRNDKMHAALVPQLWGSPEVPPSPRPLPIPPPDTRPAVSISSMGKVDSIVKPDNGAFKVHDAWVTGEELRSGLGLFLGTFGGQLCLSGAYNDAWHDEDEVMDFLHRCQAIVADWAGISA